MQAADAEVGAQGKDVRVDVGVRLVDDVHDIEVAPLVLRVDVQGQLAALLDRRRRKLLCARAIGPST
jgi:hypothetical protein